MSSTRFFLNFEDHEYYDYYKMIEDDDYFRPLKRTGNFRVHGKYVSTFHSGRKPNEYYCNTDEAMVLRSGKKLNYIQNTIFYANLSESTYNFIGNVESRCLSVKKIMWNFENYYELFTTCYHIANLYDIAKSKINDILYHLEKSVKGVYMERTFRKVISEEDGGNIYYVDSVEPMPSRDRFKYIFCKCHYTAIDGDKAIEQKGHHADEFLPEMRKLKKMYSKTHRVMTDSEVFKIVSQMSNDDCRDIIFSFLKAEDIKF